MATVRPARTTWIEHASTSANRWAYWVERLNFISLVDGASNFWAQSGAAAAEWYYTGGSLPGEPTAVDIDLMTATIGVLGSLAVGEYAWGDNDALGADTLYVRITGDGDPDAQAADYVMASVDVDEMPVYDGDHLMVGSKVGANPLVDPREERYRFAIRPQQPTAPAWTALGPIAGMGGSLLLVLDNGVSAAGLTLEVGVIGSDWDETTTAAQWRAKGAAIAPWRDTTVITWGNGMPQALFCADLPVAAPYGYMFRLAETSTTAFRMHRFSTIPAPKFLFHYQYTATNAEEADATARPTLSAHALAILNDRAEYRRFETTLTILASERDPSLSDITIAHVTGAPALLSRRANWPEAWLPDVPAAGGLPLSILTDGAKVVV
jgi:hypothetical protein